MPSQSAIIEQEFWTDGRIETFQMQDVLAHFNHGDYKAVTVDSRAELST